MKPSVTVLTHTHTHTHSLMCTPPSSGKPGNPEAKTNEQNHRDT